MALIETQVPSLRMTKVKLDTEKKILEVLGEKHKLNREVSDVISLLMDEINSLNTIYTVFAETNKMGKS